MKYNCSKHGCFVESQVTENKYYVTRKRIFVISTRGTLIKKLELPIKNDDVIGFSFMYFNGNNMIAIILMQDYYDRKAVLNEDTLAFGEVKLFK